MEGPEVSFDSQKLNLLEMFFKALLNLNCVLVLQTNTVIQLRISIADGGVEVHLEVCKITAHNQYISVHYLSLYKC